MYRIMLRFALLLLRTREREEEEKKNCVLRPRHPDADVILGSGSVIVALRDGRSTMLRKTHHIYKLEGRFQDLAWQAILCSLAYIAASSLAPVQPEQANLLMRLACEGKNGSIKIRGTKRDEITFVDLTIKMKDDGDVQDIRILLKNFGYSKDVLEINHWTESSVV